MKSLTGLVLGAVALTAVSAFAPTPSAAQGMSEKLMKEIKEKVSDEKAAAAIHERRMAMRTMGGEMKKIADFMKEGKGTPADVAAAGQKVASIAPTIPGMFPAGTGLDKYAGATGAKPEIWADPSDFKKDALALESLAKELVKVASADGADKAKIGAAFGAMGKEGCGHCHSDFRMKLN